MKIAVVGLWHTGEIYSSCLAELGYTVAGIDVNRTVVGSLRNGVPPLAEPKLTQLIKRNIKSKKLSYTTKFNDLSASDIIWITVDTPIDTGGKGSLKKIFSYLKRIIPYLHSGCNIVVSSQLPAGTSSQICEFISHNNKTLKFNYAYVPENLRLGSGIESFMNPSRVIIGTKSPKLQKTLSEIFEKLTSNIIYVSVPSAEMIKHATNAYLATSMSFIYDISDICEHVGADITEVSLGLKADARVGEKAYVDTSAGFSGGHLERDLQYLRKIAQTNKIALPVINAVITKNKKRSQIVSSKLLPILRSFKGKTITFFGITYKSGTPTLEHSLPLKVANELLLRGCTIRLYDPWVIESEIEKELPKGSFQYFSDPYESVLGSDVIICLTPWQELKKLDYSKIAQRMRNAKIFFDARNYFISEENSMKNNGIEYIGVGREVQQIITK